MKLAACYSVFNGLELLDKSLLQILPYVDTVIICYQSRSNTGNYDTRVREFIKKYDFMDKFRVVYFRPDLHSGTKAMNTKENERRKHQLMIEAARSQGCTHFFMSATDHFYNASQFVAAKEEVIKHNYDITFTSMFTYYKLPTWQLTPIEDYMMPFIIKLSPDTQISKPSREYPAKTDPSVCVNTWENYRIFDENEIIMHHYSMIRQDIEHKFKNAAASIRWGDEVNTFIEEYNNYNIEINPGVKYFQGRIIKVVPDYFGIGSIG